MRHKIKLSVALAIVAALTVAGSAIAAVTFDPSTGKGFVGKGDVQLAFGWNNADLQRNAGGVTFSYVASNTYDVTVEFSTGNPDNPRSINHHIVTQTKATAVNSSVAYDARVRNQITGFNLTGLGTTTTTGDPVPTVGDSCPNGDLNDCVVTDVQLVSSTAHLFVNFGLTSVALT